MLASQNTSTAAASDDVHGMSSLDLSDVMDDFSQMNVGSVVVACLLMVTDDLTVLPVQLCISRAPRYLRSSSCYVYSDIAVLLDLLAFLV